jgi:hypothetical protein
MNYENDFGPRRFLCGAMVGVAWVGAQGCEGTQREFVSPTDEAVAEAGRGTGGGAAAPGSRVGLSRPSSRSFSRRPVRGTRSSWRPQNDPASKAARSRAGLRGRKEAASSASARA